MKKFRAKLAQIIMGGMACSSVFAAVPNDQQLFDKLNALEQWHNVMHDSGTKDWNEHWFVDGTKNTLSNSARGMTFTTGSVEMDPAHHGVLWTKQSFAGDIKIEYDYTRLDTEHKWVNILYIQATGVGTKPYLEDISRWSALRAIPKMKTYFNHMNLLHISYAAFGAKDVGVDADYVRARRYPLSPGGTFFSDTKVAGDYHATGLFVPNEKYHVTVIKKGHHLLMEFKNEQRSRLFSWDTSQYPLVSHGRIGLRQMWRKSVIYKDFKVSILAQQ